MISIAETGTFQGKVARLLSDNEKAELIAYLAMHPNAGVLIEGTGGIRKLRWARSGGGKSGGVRVIYYFHSDMMPLYLLTIFGRNEKANITALGVASALVFASRNVSSWRALGRHPWAHLGVGVFMAGMVVTHFYAIEQIEVAYMVAVKRTSLLFGILYGAWLFNEKGLTKNLAAGLLMVLGVFLIVG